MKTVPVRMLISVLLVAIITGCASGPDSDHFDAGKHPRLDQWLQNEAFPQIARKLQSDSSIKGKPFIIAKARGESVSGHIDPLSEKIRAGLSDYLLAFADIRLIRRQKVNLMTRKYRLQDISCGSYQKHSFILTIDVKALDKNTAGVGFRAIQIKNGNWAIPGFSIYNDVALSFQQARDLHDDPYPDQSLLGEKYLPFSADQAHEMGAYLAHNLSCMFEEAYEDNNIRAYLDGSGPKSPTNIMRIVRNQLTFAEEIQLVNRPSGADWEIQVHALETGSETGLLQFWIEAQDRRSKKRIKGLTNYAYVREPALPDTTTDALPYKLTLAVLPFENLNKNNSKLNWLSNAIPETLIAKLANVPAINMVERLQIEKILDEIKLSESRFVDPASAQQAGRLLGADAVLIGNFQEYRKELRIVARTVEVEKGTIHHPKNVTGHINRIFALQDRLAEKIVAAFDINLSETQKARISKIRTTPQAFEYYARGRDFYFEFNLLGYQRAVELFQDAIRIDPDFALARAGMAEALATEAYTRKQAGESYRSLLKRAKREAKIAVKSNPELCESLRALAHVYLNSEDFPTARKWAQEALKYNRNDAESWYLLAQTHIDNTERIEAEKYYRKAIELNPRYAMAHNNLGWYVYMHRKSYDKAIDEFNRAVEISPDFCEAYDSRGEALYQQEKYEAAAEDFKKALELCPNLPNSRNRLKKIQSKLD